MDSNPQHADSLSPGAIPESIWRDFASLQPKHEGEWVAYTQDVRIGPFSQIEDLEARCRALGIDPAGVDLRKIPPKSESQFASGIDIFTSVGPVLDTAAPAPDSPLRASLDAFDEELPELLKTDEGAWVAYLDRERIGIFAEFDQLEAACQKLSLEHDVPPQEFFFTRVRHRSAPLELD